MKFLLYSLTGLGAIWLQLTLVMSLGIGGVRPNLVLAVLVVLGLRWMDPWLFVFGALIGLTMDSFSHGMLGIYAMSYVVVALVTRYIGASVYENNLVFNLAGVFMFALLEGIVSLTILNYIDPELGWWMLLFTRVLPGALYTSLLGPPLFIGLKHLEKYFKISEPEVQF